MVAHGGTAGLALELAIVLLPLLLIVILLFWGRRRGRDAQQGPSWVDRGPGPGGP
jgi:hypothetical protein